MFDNGFNRPKPQHRESGCEIKIKRDDNGNITGFKSNGKCSKEELSMFKEKNMPVTERDDEDD